MVLQAIKYRRGHLQILNQLKLPHVEVYDDVRSSNDAWHAIKEMRVRGAPAIAIVAALGLAVEIYAIQSEGKLSESSEEVALFIIEKLQYLVSSRPTAVNLADAARKLSRVVEAAKARDQAGRAVADAYIEAAEKMLVDDVQDNENIGRYGAEWILKNRPQRDAEGKVSILTHCNTGLVHDSPFACTRRCTN